jgi:hypothetical protein
METLTVSRMRARYRLPVDAGAARARLDGVLRTVLDEGLEHALAASGVPAHEEICIRSAHASVRVRGAAPDSAVMGAWSRALADALRETIARGGPDVVRYRTRGHALVDLLEGVAAGELRRSWAWRQLGLWRAGDAVSAEAAGQEAVSALLARPEAVVGAVAGAARGGALAGLARRLPAAGWRELARAALAAAAVAPGTIAALLVGAPGAAPGRPDDPDVEGGRAPRSGRPDPSGGERAAADGHPAGLTASAAPARAAHRVVRASAIARALGAAPTDDREVLRALALLAVLEAEPAELPRGAAHALALVDAVGARISAGSAPAGTRARGTRAPPDDASAPAAARTLRRAGERGQGRGRGDVEPGVSGDGSATPRRGAREPVAPAAPPPRRPAPERGRPAALDDAPDAADPTAPERPLPQLAVSAATEWGGLLFLLHVVGELDLAAAIAADPALRDRSLRWVLSRLARILLDVPEDDAAALAFAGLAPGGPPPWRGDPAPSPDEERVLALLAARLSARAYERLEGAAAPDDSAAAARVRVLARRRAEIVYEPGWLDALLRLDEVVVEVRRAGLDLDPGWLPWLGIVVRFVYA